MKNIYLVGFMGTGKTFVGKILAQKLNKKFIEMDEVIEEKAGKKIADIFKDQGEPYFRGLERALLKKLAGQNDLVISCGGGVVCRKENILLMKKSGTIINLYSSPEKIYQRTKNDKSRPLLQGEDPLGKIKDLLKQRAAFYARADYQVRSEDETPEAVAQNIVNLVQNEK